MFLLVTLPNKRTQPTGLPAHVRPGARPSVRPAAVPVSRPASQGAQSATLTHCGVQTTATPNCKALLAALPNPGIQSASHPALTNGKTDGRQPTTTKPTWNPTRTHRTAFSLTKSWSPACSLPAPNSVRGTSPSSRTDCIHTDR